MIAFLTLLYIGLLFLLVRFKIVPCDMARVMPPIRNGESVSFVALNRNKRSLVLDLKRPSSQE